MSRGMGIGVGCLAVVVLVALVLAVGGVGTYNSLVGSSQAVDAQWSQVENVYQRRADLIPNLVATVQGAAAFEKSTLEAVTQARASVGRMNVDAGNITREIAASRLYIAYHRPKAGQECRRCANRR